MPIDQADDSDDPRAVTWADELPNDGGFPPELEEEFDRLAAAAAARHSPSDQLTPELEQLEADIGMARGLRKVVGPDAPLFQFGRFEVISSVRGGMGLVLQARDPQLERDVAIKLWLRSAPEWQAALLAEAKLLAKLDHPNVVRVYEPGIWNDVHVYFVMEWIEGVDCHDWLEQLRAWQDVLRVFLAAANGLAAAHDAGIQHRDFKPSNILIGDDGRVVIADFGVANSVRESNEHETLGAAPGTPVYMAPERLRGQRGNARSDQFSFCVALWRALHGQRPFAGESREELLGAIDRREIRENPAAGVPQWLSDVVRKGLAVDPDERYGDMRELIAALQADPADEVTVGPASGAAPQRERWPYLATGFLSALVLVMGFALMRSPAAEPVTSAVQIDPYPVILGAVAADDFSEMKRLYRKHEEQLTDAQSLQIAGTCLKRAKQLSGDPAAAYQAALAAADIAAEVQRYGTTAEARKAGGQLAADALAWAVDHPPSPIE